MNVFFALFFTVILFVLSSINMDSTTDHIFKFISNLVIMFAIISGSILIGYNWGQRDAMRGKFDYKMEIKYELRDSVYIPVDTTFTEIKK